MSATQRPRLAELKVGIFVIASCAILAAAIFAIGSQVGLLQDKFWAMTYLNNVSGLKPGDIVLLNGIEVGNVISVGIGESGQMPETAHNQRVKRELEELELIAARNKKAAGESAARVADLEQQLNTMSGRPDADPSAQKRLEDSLQEAKNRVASWDDQIVRDERNLERTYSRFQNIEVLMQINSEYREWVSADSKISLGSIGLLGDKYIEVSLGRSAALSQIIQRREQHWWGTETKDIVLITGTPLASFGEIITGANDILVNVENLSGKLDNMMSSFRAEQGTLGKLVNDPDVYNSLDAAIDEAENTLSGITNLVQKIENSDGTVASLINDPEMYSRLTASIDSLEKLLSDLRGGKGSFAQFVNNPSVHEKTEELLERINLITEDIRSGKGTLGQLATDDQLYTSARDTFTRLDRVLSEIEQGHGTLGQLAQNDELYVNLNTLTSEMVKFMYDFRQDPKKFLTIKFELF